MNISFRKPIKKLIYNIFKSVIFVFSIPFFIEKTRSLKNVKKN